MVDRVDATLGRQHHQSALGGIAYQRAILRHRIRGERHRQQVRLQIGVRLAANARDLSIGPVAAAGDGIALAEGRHLDGRHLVEGERAGLVRVDGRGRPQRLHRAQPLDDGAGGGERGRARGEQVGDDGGQAGWDGRDGEGDAGQKEGVERRPGGSRWRWREPAQLPQS